MPPAQTSATFLAVLPVPAAMSRSQSPEPRASATAASSTPMRHVLHLPETSALALVDPELTLVTETSALEEGSGVDLVADPVDLEADPVDSVASRVDSVASRVDLAVNNSADSREALVHHMQIHCSWGWRQSLVDHSLSGSTTGSGQGRPWHGGGLHQAIGGR